MTWRRDAYGIQTYPFWRTVLRLTPFWVYRWKRTRSLWFAIAARSYGEEERWCGRVPAPRP